MGSVVLEERGRITSSFKLVSFIPIVAKNCRLSMIEGEIPKFNVIGRETLIFVTLLQHSSERNGIYSMNLGDKQGSMCCLDHSRRIRTESPDEGRDHNPI